MTIKEQAHEDVVCDVCGNTVKTGIKIPFWAGNRVGSETRYGSHTTAYIEKYSVLSQMSLDFCPDCFRGLKRKFFYKHSLLLILFFYFLVMALPFFLFVFGIQSLQSTEPYIDHAGAVRGVWISLIVCVVISGLFYLLSKFIYNRWDNSRSPNIYTFDNNIFSYFISFGSVLRQFALDKAQKIGCDTIMTESQYQYRKELTDGDKSQSSIFR